MAKQILALVVQWAFPLGYNAHWLCGRWVTEVRGSNPGPCGLLVHAG